MRKVIHSFTVMLIAATAALAQGTSPVPEYGTLVDIKALHRVFVYSEDLEARGFILEELSKDSQLQVVGKVEEAEFFIFYGRSFLETGYSSFGAVFGGVFGSVTTRNTAEIGDYYVLMRGDKLDSGAYRQRILWGKQNLRVFRGNPFIKVKPAVKEVTKKFVKELQKARL